MLPGWPTHFWARVTRAAQCHRQTYTDRIAAACRRASPSRRRSRSRGLRPALGPLARVRVEEALAQPNRRGRHLDQFVVLDICYGLLQAHAAGRCQQHRVVLAGGADVGEFLLLDRIDLKVAAAAVLAEDHALVNL